MARAGPVDGIFNALFLMKRKYVSLKFREPQRMELNSAWGKGNQLFKWYYGLNNHIIDTIQLRKEREPPLYHEYFAFRLRSDAGCFRVDRLPQDQNINLAGLLSDEVLARDTISPISYLESRSPHASDCLVEITFKDDVEVDLKLLLDICRAISQNSSARMYSFERYSSSFYSQTLFTCLAHEYTIETATERPGPPNNPDQQLDAVQSKSTGPTKSPNPLHRNYPNTIFITHEDQCATCWKLALFRRVVSRGGEIDSAENVSGLFWDGVARVAGEFVRLLDTTENSRNELWFLCPRIHWMEVCCELTYQAVRDTWDTRLDLFEQNFVSLAGMPSGSECSLPDSKIPVKVDSSGIGRFPTIIRRMHLDFQNSNSPIAQFFEGKIDKGNVRAELKKCVYDVCQKSGTFHMALNKYYETINERMDIQFGFKFYHPGTSDLISALSNILSQSSYADLPEHLHIPQDFLSQSQLKYASNYKKHGMEELQEYLVLLLYARGVRIEAYKDRLGSDATTVVRDVANTRKEIWNAILKERP
ncbi:unnamed protein product [Rhizoctonia solani]|uniref:Uncharacterized protein n=1 Tax=Rhizoctonia solani TaxID=456999 RepID=A0A8H3DT06_9AGAM|nr:unnamed protein product [Rhizoctonia solani]CAE6538169.1 unnamed protein product [Rhizoctonia solani]